MKIQSVSILGAGAVGCYVLWGLADKAAANALQLGVVAEDSRAERLRQNGCTINGQVYHPQVWTPQQAHGVDLLIVSLKYGALPGALDSIRTIVSERTVVMSLMNGVDSEELIAAQVGAAHVLPALIKVASHRTEDGVRFDPETTIGIIYGELTAPFDSDRVQAVRALFADTGIHFRVTEHIREEIWSKFRLNVCNNLPQAILGAGVGCYSDSAHIKAISDGLRRELEAIAAAKGIDLSKAAAASTYGSTVPPTARYSTLQDLDAGRHTEIDMFSGALMRMGRELDIPTPYNEYTYHMIKALEENNIPIDYITGTSIGAIIGSLYAMGYSPEEMLELMLSKEFSYWQTGTVEEQYTYYFKEPYPTPEFAHFSIDMSDSLQIKASFLPQSLINPIQMNQAFMALFSQATAKAGWNFDNLFVPFRHQCLRHCRW